MHAAQSVHHHELGPEEPDAVDVHGGDFLGVLGDGEVDVQPGGEHRCGSPRPAPSRARGRAAPATSEASCRSREDTAPS